MARYTDPFGDMDDIFNQLWGNNGLSSERDRKSTRLNSSHAT